jgi:hypothetical protein
MLIEYSYGRSVVAARRAALSKELWVQRHLFETPH